MWIFLFFIWLLFYLLRLQNRQVMVTSLGRCCSSGTRVPQSPDCWSFCNVRGKIRECGGDDAKGIINDNEGVQSLGGRGMSRSIRDGICVCVVEAGRLNHRAPIDRHKVNSAEWTRLEFCLWLSFPHVFPLDQAFHLCLSFPHIGFQQNVSIIAHSTPRGSLPPTDPHTGISWESHPYSTVSSLTAAPPFLHPQTFPLCNTQLTSSIQNLIISPIICIGHPHGSKTE